MVATATILGSDTAPRRSACQGEGVEAVAVPVIRTWGGRRAGGQVRVDTVRPTHVEGDHAHDDEHDHRDQCSDQTESASHLRLISLHVNEVCDASHLSHDL